MTVLPEPLSNLIEPTTMAMRPAIPVRPMPSSLKDKSLIFLRADDNKRTAIDMPIIEPVKVNRPFWFMLSLSITAKEPINSVNIMVNAPMAPDNLALSIKDRTNIEPVNKAIAPAIFIREPAFN